MLRYVYEAPETNEWLTTSVCIFQEYQVTTHGLCPLYAAGNSQFWEEWRSSGFPFWFVSSRPFLPPFSQLLLFPIMLHGNCACGSGVYKVQSIIQTWIIVEIRKMKTVFQNCHVIYQLECVMPWCRNTEHSVKCLNMLILVLTPTKIKTWKVQSTRSSLWFGITDKLQICHKIYYNKIYYCYYNSCKPNDISLVNAPI